MKLRFILGWIVDKTTSVINFQWKAQNSEFGHVRTYSSLHKLRNTQGKIHGTYLRNIYGIYQECIRSIHRYLWEKIIRNTGAAFGGRPIGSVFLMIFSHRYLRILLLHSWYLPYMFPRYVPCTGGYFPLCVS